MSQKAIFSTEEFQYKDTSQKSSNDYLQNNFLKNRHIIIDHEDIIEELLIDKSDQEQINCLYSAVIDGNEQIIDAIIECGNPDIFTEEIMEKIYDAVINIAESQAPDKKKLLENQAMNFAETAGIEIYIKNDDV